MYFPDHDLVADHQESGVFIVAVILLPLLQNSQRFFMVNLKLFHLITSMIAWGACRYLSAAGLWRDDKTIVNTRDPRRGPRDALGLFPLHQRPYMARQRDFSIGGFDHDPVFAEQRAGRERGGRAPAILASITLGRIYRLMATRPASG
jgi:hypothetical protein